MPLDGRTLRITDLFQSTVLSTDGVGASAVWPALQYGFVAHVAGEWLIVRWTEAGIRYHHGRAVPESEVFAALGPGPEKAR
ncbi:MAG: hypothetical protein HY736_08985 [Verrucomicrobia bacterium]|nr:hypothetical protein [Verrucomicrobiota bacterium]